ncbi:MAG: low molecular weight protein-tyrosine-phosphatase [Verrucomicrobiota bacterium]
MTQDSNIAPIRILFVCMGNICRSPAAEGVFRHRIQELGKHGQIDCDSAGTIHYHAGSSADPRMRQAAGARGYDLTSTARGFVTKDFEHFDWIIVMDDENHRDIIGMAKDENEIRKVRRFSDWVDIPNVSQVPDPYYGGERGFDHVLDIIENGIEPLLHWAIEGDAVSRRIT